MTWSAPSLEEKIEWMNAINKLIAQQMVNDRTRSVMVSCCRRKNAIPSESVVRSAEERGGWRYRRVFCWALMLYYRN